MSRVAFREGYPEVGLYYEKAARGSRACCKVRRTARRGSHRQYKENLEMRVKQNGATAGRLIWTKRAKAANLDAIHDTVHEMARDEARHGKAFVGLLKRYFN